MPGVTMTQRGPIASRSGLISCGEATQPSRPASWAMAARCSTWDSTLVGTPTSRWSARRSRLVSTVTPRQSGRGVAKSPAAFVAASAAARAIARPPLAWMSSMKTPSRVASRTAAPTVFGMSWYLRSRKTRKPRLRAVSIAAGPAAVKSCEPILHPVMIPSRRLSSASASSRLGTSRATSSRSAGLAKVGMVLLQAQHQGLALEQSLDRADGGLGAVERRVVGDVLRDRGAPDDRGVLPRAAVRRRVDDQRDLAPLHEIDHVGPVALGDLVDRLDAHAVAPENARGARRRHDREAQVDEPPRQRRHRALVARADRDEDLAEGRHRQTGRNLRLEIGLAEVVIEAHHLARGFHFRPQARVDARKLDEREDRFLDRDVWQVAPVPGHPGLERLAEGGTRRDLGERQPDRLGDERDGPGGTRIHLEDVDRVVADRELDVDEADHTEGLREPARLAAQRLHLVLTERVRRQRAGGVARVDARLLDVLHDAADEHARAVGHRVDVDLDRFLEELVDQHRMLGRDLYRLVHELAQVLIVVDDSHRATAQHVGGPDQHGVADLDGDRARLVERARGRASRLVQPELGDQRVEALPILGAVDRIRRGAEDRHARIAQRHRQLERRLTTELHDHAEWPLALDDVEDVLQGQGLEVEPI